jgi:hypothetical protein
VDKQCELEFGAGFKLCPYKDQVRGGVSVGVFLLFSRIPLSARLRRLVVHLQRRLRLPLQLAAVGRRHLVRQGPLVPPRGVHPARQEAAHAGHRRMGTLATVSYHRPVVCFGFCGTWKISIFIISILRPSRSKLFYVWIVVFVSFNRLIRRRWRRKNNLLRSPYMTQ